MPTMRKIFLFSLAFLFLIIISVNLAYPADEETVATATTSAPSVRYVTAIEIKGNKAVGTNVIVSKMKTKVGSPYQENVISDDLKRLYLLGYFDDINIDTKEYKDGIKIIITVTERPVIEKITFSGITHLMQKEDKIKEQLKSKEGQYLDYPTLNDDVQALKKMYEKIGYSNADIQYSVDIHKDTNKAKVQFNVNENKKVRIKAIRVEGNKSFKTGRILKLMKTKHAWLFNAGIFKDEYLTEDIERIKAFYRQEGFADVAANYTIISDQRKPHLLYINLVINEGKKYFVGNLTINGNKAIREKEILSRLKGCLPGKVFSEEALKEDISRIQSLYFDRGYVSVRIQQTTSVNPETGKVEITYDITENDITYVNMIKIKGNIKTKDVVIRREMRIHPGERFDGDKLKRSKERLQNLGFFDEISYDIEDTPSPDKKNLIVDVQETKTGAFSFGGGYSTVDEFVGFVEIEQKNFDWRNFPYFTGGGQDLKLRASAGTINSGFDLSFTEPWLFDYPITFGFDAYRRSHKRDEDVGYGYSETVTGGDLRLGKELTEYVRGDIIYRYDNIRISDVTDSAGNDLKQEAGENSISSITPSFTLDSRDNVFNPTQGNFLSGSVELAGLGGTKDYWKFYGRASHYTPLFRDSVIETRLRIGLAQPYGDSDRVPIYERFFVGGAETIRGYEERGIGPIDPSSNDPLGGESLLVANLEYTYPLFSFLRIAAFYDIGNVWSKMEDIGIDGLKSGVGFGIRVKTPIGPIKLDYGIPLNKAPGEQDREKSGKVHFSISHDF
ncbi:MAG: outer membrane protein assembly factor BamA [Candidatus Omnitrophica bacterium]|nr:outer membrane protein assembly factor BamA [Candidatus Omnitrophota bacterium]